MEYVWLVSGWVVYFFHHSFFAGIKPKEYLRYKWGISLQGQRILFTCLSTIGLLTLLVYNGYIKSANILPQTRLIKAFGLFLAAGGVFVIREAFKVYSSRTFIGLRAESEENFKSDGILKHIRHPLYTATILIVLGFFAYDSRWPTLVSMLCVFSYLPIGIYLEERKLVKHFGSKYVEYKNKTPMVIPDFRNR